MAVTSSPINTVTRTPGGYQPGAIIGALIGILIGATIWLFGAKYTVDGMILIANRILAFFAVHYQIGMRAELYAWLAVFPLAFSAVEWTCSPIGRSGTRHPGLILTWIVVVLLDIVSTVSGLAVGGGIPVVTWIVSFSAGLTLLSIVLTFGPEWLMKSCSRLLWRAVRAMFQR